LKPRKFSFTKALSTEHVFELLDEYGDDAKIIAGGQSLMPTLNMRLSAPELLIDISALDELKGIKLEGDKLVVGALTRHVELQRSELIAKHVPLIATAIEHVAHAAIRNRGTIGGNLSLADPASELPACSVALDAQFTIVNKTGRRVVAARNYFKDLYETDLQTGDIFVSVAFPVATPDTVHGFREFVRRRGDFASTGLVINAEMQDNTFVSLAPVFFALSNTPVLTSKTAEKILNKTISEDVITSALEELEIELEVIGDIHTSSEMKLHLAKHYFKEIINELHG
jgi:carbon-monoxide dehydrogenase medium subunit